MFFSNLGTFLALYYSLIPISLYVTIEFVRAIQGMSAPADTSCMFVSALGDSAHVHSLTSVAGSSV